MFEIKQQVNFQMQVDDLVLHRRLNEQQERQENMIIDLEKQIFKELKLNYVVHNIDINFEENIHTIFLPSVNPELTYVENFFFGHGFGASSLMKFPVISHLLTKGNVILWETRGMGLNIKPKQIEKQTVQEIEQYFLDGIKTVLNYYKSTNATFICHSFSSYLLLLFSIRHQDLTKKHIKQLLMLSPVGLTPKEEDYKNQIKSCGDVIHLLTHKLAWTFYLTYKSPLRTFLRCCKKKLIMNSLSEENLSQEEKQLEYKIMDVLISLPDGSQSLFYNYFQPRVLPKVALQPLFVKSPIIPIVMVYGGEGDWVDRVGAQRVANRFSNMVTLVQIPGITHNIALHTVQCKELFQQLFK